MADEHPPRQNRRFVDAHVHLWDAKNDWYVFPTPAMDFGLGDVSGFPSMFLLDDYRASLAAVDVVKFVHVTAAHTPAAAQSETRWLAEMADRTGAPNAIIGTLDVTKGLAELEADLDDQMTTPLYRGIRLLHGLDYDSDRGRGVLRMLADRKLVYDSVAHPGGGIAAVARAAGRHPDLRFVLEHTGWPLQTDMAHFRTWQSEIDELAAVPGATCKLSGMGMTYHRTDEAAFRRHWDHCIEVFGADRCMFASNFPVDGLYGRFDDLLAVFEATAANLPAGDAALLFGGTAERVYRI